MKSKGTKQVLGNAEVTGTAERFSDENVLRYAACLAEERLLNHAPQEARIAAVREYAQRRCALRTARKRKLGVLGLPGLTISFVGPPDNRRHPGECCPSCEGWLSPAAPAGCVCEECEAESEVAADAAARRSAKHED